MSDDGVTFINVFEIPADRVDEFVETWRERAKLMRDSPGFRDTKLHRALLPDSRFQLVNVTHYDSQEAWEAAGKNQKFRASTERAAEIATPNAALYEVVVEYP
ncbi:antibiotic biosynthesis monooxygenase family protein [Amycolatopsis japonica]|uniref:antibiotic biosynthesis monooxygenase family protein n=1 Tax=Amycolatopsis japonica TaxID=208439 RepID=UPI00332C6131